MKLKRLRTSALCVTLAVATAACGDRIDSPNGGAQPLTVGGAGGAPPTVVTANGGQAVAAGGAAGATAVGVAADGAGTAGNAAALPVNTAGTAATTTDTAGTGSTVAGAAGAATATAPAADCPTDPNLALHGGWVGCDPELTTDNPAGVQGAFYLYGDGTSCDDTVEPCDTTGCHLVGVSVDGDPSEDWGCGLGLGLNSDASEAKLPYTAAECFDVVIDGTTGGLDLRIGFTQHDGNGSTVVAPYRNIAAFDAGWSGEVCVADISCPSWSIDDELCAITGESYDLQMQVAAGETAGNYDLTLSSLIPKTNSDVVANTGSGPAQLTGAGSSCDNYYSATVGADGQEYILINNVWNPSGGQQCIDHNGTNFTITSQSGVSTDPEPVSFPAVILGRKAEHFAAGGGLPAQVSSIGSIETGFQTNASGISGTFNAAYDIWIDADQNYSGNGPDYFLMLWPWTQGNIQPAGSITRDVTIEGVKWSVWTGGTGEGGGKYIAYQAANTESLHVDLKPFFDDAVANEGLPASSYVLNVQAGFEIWDGGSGLSAEYFYANVQ